MKNNLSYYVHMVNSHQHWKFKTLRRKFGWCGEGKFWALNNMIGDADGCSLDLSNPKRKAAIAVDLDFDVPEFDTFVDFLIESCELITRTDDDHITTKITQQNLEEVNKKRKYQREWKTEVSISKTQKSNIDLEKKNIEKQQRNKRKEIKENEANASCQNAPPFDAREQFSKLELNKDILWAFIKEVQPKFIEPYVALWNIFADEKKLPQVSKLNDTRKKKFAKRIGEKSFSFLKILNKAAKSDMILKANWFTFDWILESEANYLKVLEGNYDNKDAAKTVAAETIHIKKLSKIERDINFNYERFLEGTFDVVNMYDNDYDYLLQRGMVVSHEQQMAAQEDADEYITAKKIEMTGENISSLGKRFYVIQHFKQLKHKGYETIFKPE